MKTIAFKMKSKRLKTCLLMIIFYGLSFQYVKGQYAPNQEIGIFGGTAYYIGDLNSNHFDNLGVAGGIHYRKNFDRRISFKSSALYSNVYADDKNSSSEEDVRRNLHFKTNIIDLSGQIEFNFLPYETGNSLYPWSPFVFAGVSLFTYNPKAEDQNGEWHDLQPLGTEGQGTRLHEERKPYSLTQFAIPFGMGIKISVNKYFNILFESGVRKTFTDYIDDVSTTYAGGPLNSDGTPSHPTEWTENATIIELADRHKDGPQAGGRQRGDETNKDWYSFSGVTLSFKINTNTKGCDY